LPQSVISERLTKSPKSLANQGVLGQKGVNQNYDKSIIHLSRQGERTTECVGKSAAELGIAWQS
jgi:hypothetical protein